MIYIKYDIYMRLVYSNYYEYMNKKCINTRWVHLESYNKFKEDLTKPRSLN